MRPLVRLGKVARSLVVPVVAVPVGKFGLDREAALRRLAHNWTAALKAVWLRAYGGRGFGSEVLRSSKK